MASINKNMMGIKTDISVTELFSYVMMVLGVFLDHLTTPLGLNRGLSESNVLASYCLDAGVWILLDVALVMGVAATSYVVARASDREAAGLVLVFPIILGAVRLVAGIWNLSIIF